MPPNSQSRREYVQFKRMLEQALLEVPLPAGIIDTDQIVPGAIRPENCKLDADWRFSSIQLETVPQGVASINSTSTETTEPNRLPVSSYGSTSSYTADETTGQAEAGVESTEEVVFLNALVRKVVYTLPQAAKNPGLRLYVKRTDQDANQICRIETFQDDKIDYADRITLAALESVILFSDSGKWHILSRYTPA